MMNLIEGKKLVEQLLARGHDGEPLMSVWARQRECSCKRPAFWKVLFETERKLFLQQLNDKRSFDKSFRCVVSRVEALSDSSLRRERFCSIKDFFGEDTVFARFSKTFARFRKTQRECRTYLAQYLSPSQPDNFCTGPPKGFVPLPDAEIGGCARNDIALADD